MIDEPRAVLRWRPEYVEVSERGESNQPFGDPEALLATVARLFAAEGDLAAVDLLSAAKPHFEWYSHDNWDGGFDIYNLYLDVPLSLYTKIEDRRASLEREIRDRTQSVLQGRTSDQIAEATIVVEVTKGRDWRGKARAWVAGQSGESSEKGDANLARDRFSRRHGFATSDAEITVREDAPDELREIVVDIAYEAGLTPHKARSIACRVLRRREDPSNWSPYPNVDFEVRGHLESCEWYEVYDVVESLCAAASEPAKFEQELNDYFRRRGIGWQLVDGLIQTRGPEAFERTVADAHESLAMDGRATAAQEIHEALQDLSRRPKPDITGSVQHAIAALECVARDVADDPKATLGTIIKKHPGILPAPLDAAVDKLWGFASEQGRHLREGREPAREDAELVVQVAAAVATYLSKKADK